jgi:hypothetical protein
MAVATAVLGWVICHTETSFADGLRYIRQAEQIQSGAWRDGLTNGIDHPLHALEIAAVHRALGGSGPVSWQRAAMVLCFTSAVILVVPLYLLALELFGETTAWVACVLAIANPIIGYIVVNVLSESTFLFWWTFGLWGAVRFLRDGRLIRLPAAIGFGALAYLTRPEGMLLPAALTATLLILPLVRATRISRPRWLRVGAFVIGGLLLLAGPYMTLRGGVATKPGIARVLGLAPPSQPLALEREKPLPPGQTSFEAHGLGAIRTLKVFRAAVTPPLFPFALLGIVLAGRRADGAGACIFLGIVLVASAVGLVRLHATGGYCTIRHGLVPGLILTVAAACGLTGLTGRISIPGRWLGLARARVRPSPAVWAILIALLIVAPTMRSLGPRNAGPFSVYRAAGDWLIRNTQVGDPVLDLTNWSLFFSQRPGYVFANVYEAAADPETRWIVVRKPHVDGRWHYSDLIRALIGGREPVALFPTQASASQVQIRIYDRRTVVSMNPPPVLTGALPGDGRIRSAVSAPPG